MFFVYSAVYAISLVILMPYFLLNKEKYLAGFKQRFGFIPEFTSDGRPVIWLHCVSVGETNSAKPLIETILKKFPNYRIVVTTTTKTGQELAHRLFANKVDLIFYMPFDLAFLVRRVMNIIKPTMILIVETEIWFNFMREASRRRSRVVIVNGRLSEKSTKHYSWIPKTMKRVFRHVDLALMQTNKDARRLVSIGMRKNKVKVTGNVKFDQRENKEEKTLTAYFKERFGFEKETPLIVAASTHAPEEKWILESFKKMYMDGMANLPRLVIVPRHPERFDEVADLIAGSGLSYVRRTAPMELEDELVDIVLLDSIGELRSIYPLADIVFVGGSLIPHGGQSIMEPALARTTIVTGHSMTNFEAVAREFAKRDAIVQLPRLDENSVVEKLAAKFTELIQDTETKDRLARNAYSVMHDNRGASNRTLKYLTPYLKVSGNVPGS